MNMILLSLFLLIRDHLSHHLINQTDFHVFLDHIHHQGEEGAIHIQIGSFNYISYLLLAPFHYHLS